jgi:TolA-binding protein
MRIQSLLLILLAGAAAPAIAQGERVDRRVEKLEAEMRAVQRKVFPGGRQALVQPEIGPAQAAGPTPGIPAGSAVSDLTARIDALEASLARLTGQAEENGNRLRQLEASFTGLRSEFENRMAAAQAAPQMASQQQPASGQRLQTVDEQSLVPEASAILDQAEADPEQAYLAGFKLWEQKRFADAQKALDAMAKRYPSHPKASWARNLAGRALLDDGKPAAAAKTLFANYETDPKGERAPDSLFYLGQALTQLKKNTEACQVYSELQEVYGAALRDQLKRDLPRARKAAGCGA